MENNGEKSTIKYDRYSDKISYIDTVIQHLSKKDSDILGKETLDLIILKYVDNATESEKEIIIGELKDTRSKEFMTWLKVLNIEDIRNINNSIETLSDNKDSNISKADIWNKTKGIGSKLSEYVNFTEEGHKLLEPEINLETLSNPTLKTNYTIKRNEDLCDLNFSNLVDNNDKNIYDKYFKDSKTWREMDKLSKDNTDERKNDFINDLKNNVEPDITQPRLVFSYKQEKVLDSGSR